MCLLFREFPREPLGIIDCMSPDWEIPEGNPGIIDCVSPVYGIAEGTPRYSTHI